MNIGEKRIRSCLQPFQPCRNVSRFSFLSGSAAQNYQPTADQRKNKFLSCHHVQRASSLDSLPIKAPNGMHSSMTLTRHRSRAIELSRLGLPAFNETLSQADRVVAPRGGHGTHFCHCPAQLQTLSSVRDLGSIDEACAVDGLLEPPLSAPADVLSYYHGRDQPYFFWDDHNRLSKYYKTAYHNIEIEVMKPELTVQDYPERTSEKAQWPLLNQQKPYTAAHDESYMERENVCHGEDGPRCAIYSENQQYVVSSDSNNTFLGDFDAHSDRCFISPAVVSNTAGLLSNNANKFPMENKDRCYKTKTSDECAAELISSSISLLKLSQGHRCENCNKHFSSKSALAKHRLIHSKDRKYVCPSCSKTFKRQDHLNGHVMTHMKRKPFSCKVPNCYKSYCDSRSLKRHIECQHQHLLAGLLCGDNRVREYLPPIDAIFVNVTGNVHRICLKSGIKSPDRRVFQRLAELVKDSSETTVFSFEEPKPISCSVCGKGFKNMAALYGHMRLHGGYSKAATSSTTLAEGNATSIVNGPLSDNTLKPPCVGNEPLSASSSISGSTRSLSCLSDTLACFSLDSQSSSAGKSTPCVRSLSMTSAGEDLAKFASPSPMSRRKSEECIKPTDLRHVDYTCHNKANISAKPCEMVLQQHCGVDIDNLSVTTHYRPPPILKKVNSTFIVRPNYGQGQTRSDVNKPKPGPNIGHQYQACVPDEFGSSVPDEDQRDLLLWRPDIIDDVSLSWDTVEKYLNFSRSKFVTVAYSAELALFILHKSQGDMFAATRALLQGFFEVQGADIETASYIARHRNFPHSVPWSPEELQQFESMLTSVGKDFSAIASKLEGKTTGDCIELYYLLKSGKERMKRCKHRRQ